MTPQQVQILHEMNDFLGLTLHRLRLHQSRVTQMLATAEQEHTHEGSEQELLEKMFALRRIPHAVLPFDGSTRVDVVITTAADGAEGEEEAVNVEFQFDDGEMIGMRTLVGERV